MLIKDEWWHNVSLKELYVLSVPPRSLPPPRTPRSDGLPGWGQHTDLRRDEWVYESQYSDAEVRKKCPTGSRDKLS